MIEEEYRKLVNWVQKTRKHMLCSGSGELELMVPAKVYTDLHRVATRNNNFDILSIMNPDVRIEGILVRPDPSYAGGPAPTHASGKVQMRAGSCSFTSSGMTPIHEMHMLWPPCSHAKEYIEYIEKVKEWCIRKGSPFFQRRDVARINGLSPREAYNAMKYARAKGDIENRTGYMLPTRWWHFKFESTPRQSPNVFDLAANDMISKKTAMAQVGIDFNKEATAMKEEMAKMMAVPKEMM